MNTGEPSPAVESKPRQGPKPVRTTLCACSDKGGRTVLMTRDGQSLVTDEPVSRGGTGTAPTPLETVVGALCGCSAVTSKCAARELGLDYEGIEFDAGYRLDRRGLLGEAEVRPYFEGVDVDARVGWRRLVLQLDAEALDDVELMGGHRSDMA